eukprot:c19641_g1_i3 orf=207-1640(-)
MDASSTAHVPAWLNNGDNAWQLIAATLVGMQSVPGLMSIYAGLMRRRWAVNSAFMALYAFAATLICWVLFAYKFAFGEKLIPIWGKPGLAVQHSYLLRRASLPASSFHYKDGTIKTPEEMPMFPMATLVYFQFAFAAVTVVLLAGSLLGRMNFNAWMMFVPLWVTFSYTVGAFTLWGGGFLYHWGVIDFAGGFVIHLSSGVAGYTAAYWVGPRLKDDQQNMDENFSVPLVGVGAGILWLGWTGFNGGAPYAAGIDASMAVLNTHMSAATSLLIWTVLDAAIDKETSILHAVQGMIAGLVCITPAAGVVEGWAAIVIGLSAGGLTWLTMIKGEKLLDRLHLKCFENVDDTLRVFHTHAVSGLLGGILTGLLAEPSLCDLFLPVKGSSGSFYGSGVQVLKQLVGAAFIAVWNVIVTSIICFCIGLLVPLKMDDNVLRKDLPNGYPKEKFVGHNEGKSAQELYGSRIKPFAYVEPTPIPC